MRVIVDVDFGNTNSRTYFGVFDYETNTLEYIAQTTLEGKVSKGYDIIDLVMNKVTGQKPTIDIIHTQVHDIPAILKSTSTQRNAFNGVILNLQYPIYLKNLKSGRYFSYKNVTFVYQKRKKYAEWGVHFYRRQSIKDNINVLLEMTPYLLCGDKFVIQMDTTETTIDFSDFALLSQTHSLQFQGDLVQCQNLKVSGVRQNIDISNLIVQHCPIQWLDMTELVDGKQIVPSDESSNYQYVGYLEHMQGKSVILLPNIKEMVDSVVHLFEHNQKKTFVNMGVFNRNSNFASDIKTKIARKALMQPDALNTMLFVAVIA